MPPLATILSPFGTCEHCMRCENKTSDASPFPLPELFICRLSSPLDNFLNGPLVVNSKLPSEAENPYLDLFLLWHGSQKAPVANTTERVNYYACWKNYIMLDHVAMLPILIMLKNLLAYCIVENFWGRKLLQIVGGYDFCRELFHRLLTCAAQGH